MTPTASPTVPRSIAGLIFVVLLCSLYVSTIEKDAERLVQEIRLALATAGASIVYVAVERSWRGLVVGGGCTVAIINFVSGVLTLYPGR